MAENFSIPGFRLSGRHFAEMAKMAFVYFCLPSSVLGGDIFADSVYKRRFQRRLSEGAGPRKEVFGLAGSKKYIRWGRHFL
jgi:hypothetical protein